MRWISMMSGLLLSPLALALQDAAPVALSHDGYRLQSLPAGPVRQAWERRRGKGPDCGAVPAAPAAATGELEVVPLVKDRFFNKFFQGGGKLYRLVAQQQGVPQAIVIRSGHWTLSSLAARLAAERGTLQRRGQAYLLRLPLLLHTGASLSLREGETLRLSRDRGAFIISMGGLYLHKARLEAWDEAASRTATGEAGPTAFQPFLVAWSGSQTVIRGSRVAGLGFDENLARGITVAEGPIGLAGHVLPAPARFLAQETRFDDMYTAINAVTIPELRVCSNQFVASRQYALHLEGGSGGLVRGNQVTGSRGPYSVYVGDGVQHLRLLENDISENHRSGLSVNGGRNIILAGNTIRQNYDAVFLQGVDEVLIADNHILDNQRHGVSLRSVGRVRFQDGVIGPNRGVGVLVQPGGKPAEARTAAAATTVAATPTARASAPSSAAADTGRSEASPAVVSPAVPRRLQLLGVRFFGNHSSTLVMERPYALLMEDVQVLYPGVRRRPVFRGVLNHFEDEMLKRLAAGQVVSMEPLGAPRRSLRRKGVAAAEGS